MSLRAQKARFVVVDLRGRHQKWSEKKQIIKTMWKPLQKRNDLEVFLGPNMFWDACKEKQRWMNRQSNPKPSGSEDSWQPGREWRKRSSKRKQCVKKDRCLEPRYVRPCPKMCRDILPVCKERCTFSPVGGNSVRGRSPDSSRRFWGTRRTLWCMCPDCFEMLVLARHREARFDLVSRHSGRRPVAKWNKACGKRLLRVINYINQTKDDRPFCDAGNEFEDCKLGVFQNASFTSDLQDSKSGSGGILCIFLGSRTSVPIPYLRKKQSAESRSCEET